ncbi:FkbM family methyltransferase [Haladaptatus sp. AB643]|uniref:FkbM family methyltransferase n=1 Tax=Haladaptatus sp. AB643 TaxID=2934174 RepID=UPI00209BF606|nr:FkbM family methyltransferase [Haladaptatus sp. AB643]MCO8244778.1 FkbM family methyltransferase [Haladaptatus sp. AB643]
MADGISNVVSKLPRPVINALQNTPADDCYQYVRYRTQDIQRIPLSKDDATETLFVPKQSHLYRKLRQGGVYEPQLTKAITAEFENGDTFYDVGSQYGYFTTLAKLCGVPSRRIHGFEANDYHHRVLRKTHATDGVSVVHTYVGDGTTDGMLALKDYEGIDPDIVKIDVEGFEHDVLQGMGDTLSNVRCLFVEIHPQFLARRGATPEKVFNLLDDEGFDLRVTEHRESNRWDPISAADLPDGRTYLIRGDR